MAQVSVRDFFEVGSMAGRAGGTAAAVRQRQKREDALKRLADDPAASRHSPLYLWLAKNRDRVLTIRAANPRPTWASLAREIAVDGILDGAGKPATTARLKATWRKVLRDTTPNPAVTARNLPKRGAGSGVTILGDASLPSLVLRPAMPKPLK